VSPAERSREETESELHDNEVSAMLKKEKITPLYCGSGAGEIFIMI